MELYIPDPVANVGAEFASGILQPTHANFRYRRHHVYAEKNNMAMFIRKHCRTLSVRNPPCEGWRYSLSLAGREGLIMRIKGNSDIAYVFNVVTGNVYILEWQHGFIGRDGRPQNHSFSFEFLSMDLEFGFIITMLMDRRSMRPRVIRT